MSALSDLLRSNPRGLSARTAAARADDMGIDLRRGTLSGYFAGNHGSPSDDLLQAMSAVLDIPLAELRVAAGRRAQAEPYVPPRESYRLTTRQRLALDELIRSMVAEK